MIITTRRLSAALLVPIGLCAGQSSAPLAPTVAPCLISVGPARALRLADGNGAVLLDPTTSQVGENRVLAAGTALTIRTGTGDADATTHAIAAVWLRGSLLNVQAIPRPDSTPRQIAVAATRAGAAAIWRSPTPDGRSHTLLGATYAGGRWNSAMSLAQGMKVAFDESTWITSRDSTTFVAPANLLPGKLVPGFVLATAADGRWQTDQWAFSHEFGSPSQLSAFRSANGSLELFTLLDPFETARSPRGTYRIAKPHVGARTAVVELIAAIPSDATVSGLQARRSARGLEMITWTERAERRRDSELIVLTRPNAGASWARRSIPLGDGFLRELTSASLEDKIVTLVQLDASAPRAFVSMRSGSTREAIAAGGSLPRSIARYGLLGLKSASELLVVATPASENDSVQIDGRSASTLQTVSINCPRSRD